MRILDIGCGINPQKDANYRIDKVKTQYTTHVINIENEPLPFNDDYFDKIYAICMLEHLFDIEYAIREIYRCLKTDGIFILQVPYFRYPIGKNPLHKSEWSWCAFDYWLNEDTRMLLKNTPKFKLLRKEFIFSDNMNKWILKLCQFIIKRNPFLYENTLSVFFSARLIHIEVTK